MYKDLFEYGLKNIRHKRLRSWLTVLGIVIGVAAIVLLIGIAQGLGDSVQDSFKVLGTNYAFIIPGNVGTSAGFGGSAPALAGQVTQRDLDAINRVQGVDFASGILFGNSMEVQYKKEKATLSVSGVQPNYGKSITTGYDSGGFFGSSDKSSAVIGYNIANEFFDDKIKVGNTISINGHDFKVVGITSKVGEGGFGRDDDIVINIDALREITGAGRNEYSGILAISQETVSPEIVGDRIKRELRNTHRVKEGEEDFTVFTAALVEEQFGQILGLLTTFVGGVAIISLIVGGIGVANSMFTSVLERTREIGILKAIGANNDTILKMFLIESALIGLVGGLIGVVFSVLILLLLKLVGVPAKISLELITTGLLFALIIGTISGAVPARNASRLPAIQALRYE
ncbi:ABC transporter permease [Candidatus Micrarchaeota archaeon]|nr:ABC transporter permease [Candidatus Micrarchaeota archaeon]